MDPVQEDAPKVPKTGTTKTSRSGSEGNAGKVLHFKILSLKKGILQQFASEQQKRWREPSSHKFEGMESVHSLQALHDGRFAKICVAKKELHVQNRPEGCTLQRFSTQRFMKVSTVSLGRKLVRVPVPMLWFGTSSHNIHKIIKGSNLSSETSDDITVIIYLNDLLILGKSISEILTARDSVIFLLQHLGFVRSLKKCVLDPVREIELLGLILNSHAMTLSLPNEKIVKDKRSIPEFLQSIRGITSGFEKTNRYNFFNHSSSTPSPSTVLLLTTTANSISKTNTVLPHFGKADSHGKKRIVMVDQQSRTLQ